ncbi:HlyD family type I secretion periplasmic adaptor subunit, partial [Herbaspirillum sp. YR522]|uniref:HlyD family type I secretion periplasmic adaptor subunit n=1 Tax=Herbaspirillum sp. YR522 TaxID=1144342 RepID=UPI00026F766C
RPADIAEPAWLESQRLLASQLGEFRARLARLEAEVIRRQASLAATRALVGKLEQTLPIARRRAQDLKDLAERRFVSHHGYLEREQVRIEQEGDLDNLRARLREIEASLREADSQKSEIVAQARRATLDTLTRALQQQASLEQELAKAELQGRLTELRAPVAGTVQQLAIHTESGVVTPAQPLMMIVPRDQLLEVEAFLENKDIGFVRAGQQAEVKLESFPFTKFGTIAATVGSVSHDAISDDKRGLVYSSRVQLQRHTMQVDGVAVALSPGMAVAVEIKTGRRRVIEYFLSPLIAYANESLRER